ncbi:MAG TPA: hypothetical protein VH061_09900 [Solirubrobacteraceae bacterium]|jgi:hypothetical protein|nr:hypothetical protein [Solirubrobacteraceae bacterium]
MALAGTLVVLGGGGAPATASSAASGVSYTALSSSEPTGLPLVESHQPASSSNQSGPTWPAQPPQEAAGRWPVTSTIRRLSLSVPGLSAWIARSGAGGICVLLYDGVPAGGVSAVDMGCSSPEGLARGASVEVSEIPGLPGKTIAAGVVPDGVTAVTTTMADGSTETAPVKGNAWARVGDQPAAAGQQSTETIGG